jgi:hypothetical protein
MADSESPTRSNSISTILSKTRLSKKSKGSASNSTKSSESDGNGGVRASLEGAMEKLKGRGGIGEDGDSNGLNILLPKTIVSKRRRKKQEKEEEELASEEAARGRNVAERGTLQNDARSFVNGSEDNSSLMTYDSDTES